MSSVLFQRAGWSLQFSRSTRHFSVSISTRLPHRRRQHRLLDSLSTQAETLSSTRVPSSRTSARTFSASNAFRQGASTATATEAPRTPETNDLSSGFNDEPLILDEGSRQVDWARSFHGLSTQPFPKEAADILIAPVNRDDVEVKPDGILYLPEIKYRRILNRAFGPGAWGLAPRGETIVTPKAVTREYALVVMGRLVSVARGEQDYFSPEGIPTAAEGCKSNALMRCCKDLGIASELWDPHWIREFGKERVREIWVEHTMTKKKRKIALLKGREPNPPYKESKGFGAS